MNRRHINELTSLLDQLISEHIVFIQDSRLKQLLGYERLRENSWRELHAIWKEVCDENNIKDLSFKVMLNEQNKQYVFFVMHKIKNIEELV